MKVTYNSIQLRRYGEMLFLSIVKPGLECVINLSLRKCIISFLLI